MQPVKENPARETSLCDDEADEDVHESGYNELLFFDFECMTCTFNIHGMVERRLLGHIPWMAMMRRHIQHTNFMAVSGTVSFFRGSVFLHRYSTLTKYFFLQGV
jgi:hypothetical protein